MKKFILLFFMCFLAFGMFACTDEEEPPVIIDNELDIALPTKWDDFLKEKTVYLTTIGQADIDIVANILSVAGINETSYTRKELLTASEVTDNSVVLIVTGTSAKGMGAAGIDLSDEQQRATDFATKANQDKITVIVLHVGGSARRGSSTDPILNIICPKSDLMMIVNTANSDNLFTNIARNNVIDLSLYSKTSKMTDAFKQLFAIE